MAPTVDELVSSLGLMPHPEGGFFIETFRDDTVYLEQGNLPDTFKASRAVSTAIYFLMPSGNVSHLHRMPSAEVWHFYMGDPLTVVEIDGLGNLTRTVLGNDLAAGQQLQHVVRPGVWFGAYPTLDLEEDKDAGVLKQEARDPQLNYSLVGCTVAPAFEFSDFELAKRGSLISSFPGAAEYITLLTDPDEEMSQ